MSLIDISQTYGHEKVSLLDGGLPKWLASGYPTVSGPQAEVPVCTYKATYHPELYRTFEQMLENRSSKKEQVSLVTQDMYEVLRRNSVEFVACM